MNIGIDIGSTTAKAVVTNDTGDIIFSVYKRHKALIVESLLDILRSIRAEFPQTQDFRICFTGSAGMGVAEQHAFPFVQEVIAASEVIQTYYPATKTLIDIGGEDAKIIFYEADKAPDIRMNGSCAGGTGAFIDQIASLLNIETSELHELAAQSTQLYTIASRCGVFAKTDVQNLIARKVPIADIAASAFYAVSLQVINALSRGVDIQPQVLFIGGPLTYIPALRHTLQKQLHCSNEEAILPKNSHVFPAWGAAIEAQKHSAFSLEHILACVQKSSNSIAKNRLAPLFQSAEDFAQWKRTQNILPVPAHAEPAKQEHINVFLGIDSGSTTTKVVLLNAKGELIASHYDTNKGNPIQAAITGLEQCVTSLNCTKITILRSAVTGYGEDLLKAAFSIDESIVETIAHTTAAQKIAPNVSFIMDIGGQDMKAIYIKNGAIQSIEINEACSSGCGSFIQNFAHTLSHTAAEFGELACTAKNPCDLGSRCTVFMNSQVKQALREGAEVSEISAGLAYSVIKNALFKVLQIKNMDVLGDTIIVQGGTFKNPAIFRAMEILTGKTIARSDKPELMGALGAAYYAHMRYEQNPQASRTLPYEERHKAAQYSSKQITCKGCSNNCIITRCTFSGNATHYSGNKCEKIFSSKGQTVERGENLFEYKYDILFNRVQKPYVPSIGVTIGIPRILGMYANYPFWNTLLTHCGIRIVLSDESTTETFEKGQGTIMADNICFPAKIAHGHILNLAEKEIDRIFYPLVIYEENEHAEAKNSFNCPIVSSYSEVLQSAIPAEKRNNIPLDKPVISFRDEALLKRGCWRYLKSLGVRKDDFRTAFKAALAEQKNYREQYRLKGFRIMERAKLDGKPIIMLASRPYHIDPLVHQKTSDILCELGASVVSEEVMTQIPGISLTNYLHVAQWNYPNRILKAAQWALHNQDYNISFVQLNSFGCGPDSFISDELKELFDASQASYTFIRVDEINSTGSVRLRLRSLIETLKLQNEKHSTPATIQRTPVFTKNDTKRHIIGPFFTRFHSPFIAPAFELMGYSMESLPPSNKESVELGLQYANNEVCYPATLVVGDIIKYLQQTDRNLDDVAVVMTQTGGQCRASNYLSLIRKAILHAGITNVPVISLATAGDKALNEQPGFELEYKKIINIILAGMIFGDIISRMHHATIVREKEAGATEKLTQSYIDTAVELARHNNHKEILELLRRAVNDYNALAMDNCPRPQIGIVGEIFLKFNPYANMYVGDWLISQGVEPRFPDLTDFFTQEFVNLKTNVENNLSTMGWGTQFIINLFEQKIGKFAQKAEKIAANFKYYRPKHSIYDEAKNAEQVIDLVNQFGEGWLIPAEIISFAKEGVNNVVSLQPFGCIANHIVSKGIEKNIKTLYPNTNLLFLDFDGGTSEVNIFNRLHFLVQNAKNEVSC
ncbi:MAG: acyl-CoA dehydratase activase [Bacteroidales bacterium]|jgi:predicted CoA-substrate-specific enzyme activase|nr:acyl-CoA dehydratase activase [Bacteroidales bacterium]